jgi:RNA polymerase sigma-70 factor, ECF subfamily
MYATAAAPRTAERRLIARAINGDQEAFAELYQAHKNNVYSLCLRMTANTAEAEDLTQEAFIQVFRKLGSFRGDSAFSTWVYRVTTNIALMHFRKKSLRQVSLDRPATEEAPKERIDLAQEDGHLNGTVDRIALIRAIGELPEGYRSIFLLHDVEGYGHGEIARRLHCSTGNTKSQLHKARMKIRESLRQAAMATDQTKLRVVQASEAAASPDETSDRISSLLTTRLTERTAS